MHVKFDAVYQGDKSLVGEEEKEEKKLGWSEFSPITFTLNIIFERSTTAKNCTSWSEIFSHCRSLSFDAI